MTERLGRSSKSQKKQLYLYIVLICAIVSGSSDKTVNSPENGSQKASFVYSCVFGPCADGDREPFGSKEIIDNSFLQDSLQHLDFVHHRDVQSLKHPGYMINMPLKYLKSINTTIR